MRLDLRCHFVQLDAQRPVTQLQLHQDSFKDSLDSHWCFELILVQHAQSKQILHKCLIVNMLWPNRTSYNPIPIAYFALVRYCQPTHQCFIDCFHWRFSFRVHLIPWFFEIWLVKFLPGGLHTDLVQMKVLAVSALEDQACVENWVMALARADGYFDEQTDVKIDCQGQQWLDLLLVFVSTSCNCMQNQSKSELMTVIFMSLNRIIFVIAYIIFSPGQNS